jgi:hypothetical protein
MNLDSLSEKAFTDSFNSGLRMINSTSYQISTYTGIWLGSSTFINNLDGFTISLIEFLDPFAWKPNSTTPSAF